MPELTPEMLAVRMAKSKWTVPSALGIELAEDMLRVVLSAIESGEVVEIGEEYINNEKLDRMEWFYKIKLNPDFKAWLNGEGNK